MKPAEQLGENIRAMRTEQHLSQSRLAELMRERGHSEWHQTTVARVEKGKRSLSAGDLVALDAILGGNLYLGTNQQLPQIAAGQHYREHLENQIARLTDARQKIDQTVDALQADLDALPPSKGQQLRELRDQTIQQEGESDES